MKFFVCSDIHSAYTPWMKALDEAGFNKNNDSHKIIMCGDLFDRTNETLKVYDFAKEMLDKDKMIYVRGNHEVLITEMCERGYPLSHDLHNGTVQTVKDLSQNPDTWEDACAVAIKKLKPLLNKTVNYYETKNYVFCHSTLPYGENWRNTDDTEWNDAMWPNPFIWAKHNGNKTGKTIVFGHYHTSWAWSRDGVGPEFDEDACFKPYHGKGYIGIDSCVAYTGFCNVIVIEDKPL